MKRVLFYLILFGAVLSFSSCKNAKQPLEKSTWVKCDTVRFTPLVEYLQFPAQIKAAQEVNLSFKVSGTLQQVLVSEGETVKQGDLIAQIDPRDYELQFQAVEAEYLNIKAEAERAIALYVDSVVTKADYDKARYGLLQITAKYENAKNQLADTKIYAPFDGVVKNRLFDPPTVIGAGMPVVTLLSSNLPEVEIYIPNSLHQRLAEISSFSVNFDFLPQAVPLRLITVSSVANANQLYAVRLALPQSLQSKPSVGMSAMVNINLSNRNIPGLAVPSSSIFHKDKSDYVWIYANNRVVKRKVVVERLSADGMAFISSGLSAGEVIVTAGVRSLKDNQTVKPLPMVSKTNIGGLL
jgi:RND family efflux transporter MFP subunit